MEKEEIVMQYIAVWAWHLTGIIFLTSSFIILFSGEALGNNVMFIAFVFAWALCEFISFRRKNKLKPLSP